MRTDADGVRSQTAVETRRALAAAAAVDDGTVEVFDSDVECSESDGSSSGVDDDDDDLAVASINPGPALDIPYRRDWDALTTMRGHLSADINQVLKKFASSTSTTSGRSSLPGTTGSGSNHASFSTAAGKRAGDQRATRVEVTHTHTLGTLTISRPGAPECLVTEWFNAILNLKSTPKAQDPFEFVKNQAILRGLLADAISRKKPTNFLLRPLRDLVANGALSQQDMDDILKEPRDVASCWSRSAHRVRTVIRDEPKG
jgi:hypothetical protein